VTRLLLAAVFVAAALAAVASLGAPPRRAEASHVTLCPRALHEMVKNNSSSGNAPKYWTWAHVSCIYDPDVPEQYRYVDRFITWLGWRRVLWEPGNWHWENTWRSYDSRSCAYTPCVKLGTQVNNNVPFPSYVGLICRQSRARYVITYHLAPLDEVEIFKTSPGMCR
jgi:hypothetical protein